MPYAEVHQWTEALQAPTVYLKKEWSHDWVEYPYVFARTLRRGVGKQIDQATLQYEYGRMTRDSSAPAFESPLSIGRWFVKIVARMNSPAGNLVDFGIEEIVDSLGGPITSGTTVTWYGIVVANITDLLGQYSEGFLLDDSGNPIIDNLDDEIEGASSAGNQEFLAVGLEWLATRKFLDSTVIRTGTGTKRIGRVLPFNSGSRSALSSDLAVRGNRDPNSPLAPLFVQDTIHDQGVNWSAYQALIYLLSSFPPTSFPEFVIHNSAYDYLHWWEPHDWIPGPTLFDAMNQLMPARRGLSWSAVVSENEGLVYIRPHSYSSSNLSLAGAKILAANLSQKSIDTGRQSDLAVTVNQDHSKSYDQVVCWGARRTSTFTLNYDYGTLENGWTSSQESSYISAASAVTPLREKKKQADTFRTSDAMRPVFTRFLIRTAWNGTVNGNVVCPDVITGQVSPMWVPGLRVQNWLALREAYDYSSSATSPTNNNPAGYVSGYRRPFVAYKLPDNKYIRGDLAMALSRQETVGKNGLSFSSGVAALTDQAGIYVSPTGPAHLHALGTINGSYDPSAFAASTDFLPEVDYEDMQVTATVQFDDRAKGFYPDYTGITVTKTNGTESILQIDLGERARLDYLVPGTVLDIGSDGSLITAASGGVLRDDRNLLFQISQVAWSWYSRPRTALTLRLRQLSADCSPGDLVASHNGEPVDSLVTYISYDFQRGETIVNTDFAEIDPVGLVA